MTQTAAPAKTRHPALTWPFLWHFGEMVIAMVIGMMLLAPLWNLFLPAGPAARADVMAFVMATNMSAAMAVWMRRRGHTGLAIAEMTAAMYAPFLVFVIPWWAGMVAAETVILGGHVLMLPAMVAVMLHRVDEYAGHHRHRPMVRAPSLLDRWPTALGLLVTLDNMIRPSVPAAWLMLILPVGYLVIGAFRRTITTRWMLIVQLAGLAAYAVLVFVTLLVSPGAGTYLIAFGWLAHAAWDVWHHRHNAVVPRGYAEWCAVVDAVIGVTVLVVAVS
jgi:hypothetical protein